MRSPKTCPPASMSKRSRAGRVRSAASVPRTLRSSAWPRRARACIHVSDILWRMRPQISDRCHPGHRFVQQSGSWICAVNLGPDATRITKDDLMLLVALAAISLLAAPGFTVAASVEAILTDGKTRADGFAVPDRTDRATVPPMTPAKAIWIAAPYYGSPGGSGLRPLDRGDRPGQAVPRHRSAIGASVWGRHDARGLESAGQCRAPRGSGVETGRSHPLCRRDPAQRAKPGGCGMVSGRFRLRCAGLVGAATPCLGSGSAHRAWGLAQGRFGAWPDLCGHRSGRADRAAFVDSIR